MIRVQEDYENDDISWYRICDIEKNFINAGIADI